MAVIQTKPFVVQPKTGVSVQSIKRPIAPPVYRPQPVPKVLQKKTASVQSAGAGQTPRRPVAPPVYRPKIKQLVQPKFISQQRTHTLPKTPAQMKARVIPPSNKPQPMRFTDRKPAVVQRYSVLPADRVVHETIVRTHKPAPPYAVITGAGFLAQQSLPERSSSDKSHDFLSSPGGQEAWIVGRPFGAAILVSDDGNMAIENSDLSRRQPKEFYATREIVMESNQALQRVGARVELVLGAPALTIVTAKSEVKLYAVTPRFERLPPQNCNAMAAEVIGSDPTFTALMATKGMKAAKKIAVKNAPSHDFASRAKGVTTEDFNKLEGALVEEYVLKLAQSRDILEREKINQYAQPGVGEAFMVGTLGPPISQNGGWARVLDLESREERKLGWGYHFAGVVAVSGNDRVTLENYARGDNRCNDPDPRWFFQMYGGSEGQTFYDFNKANRWYSNPVVVAVGK